ncbi:30S ribosomal protein S6e [Candidatus Pacearchaeota archaeon]|nr:30S ribosomal protein S6e [Candidatus Pacearchaeota archaeon]
MSLKVNLSEKGKSWKVESNSETIIGKKIGDTFEGLEVSENLSGYTLKITGATDSSGFPHKEGIQGPEMKRIILTYGWGMHKRPRKAGKKARQNIDGLRLRKTVRGQQISEKTAQLNCIIVKHGDKTLTEIFPEQNKPKEQAVPAQ